MEGDRPLFDLADFSPAAAEPSHRFAPLKYPLWTEHKAKLIARYLYYFVMVTKHGTYVDGFAGPQNNRADMWAAKLVLESKPRWLRHFHLVELDADKVTALDGLRNAENAIQAKPRRSVNVHHGDFNVLVDRILGAGTIGPKEAAFCLLDQRTFECDWQTVEKLAKYKPIGEHKIELFYFLPIGWLDRAFAGTKRDDRIVAWWGRSDWHALRGLNHRDRARLFVERIKALGYANVFQWPIYEQQGSTRVMYYMIHASDHQEAPKLMRRAYARAVDPAEPIEQLRLEWETMSP